MIMYLANAFSLNMLKKFPATVTIVEVSEDQVKQMLVSQFVSAVGHESTAQLLTQRLNVNITMNRINIVLNEDDVLIVAQLQPPQRPPRELTLEEVKQYPIKYLVVKVTYTRIQD